MSADPAPPPAVPPLSISIVTYQPEAELLGATLRSLDTALLRLAAAGEALAEVQLTLIDHSPTAGLQPPPLRSGVHLKLCHNPANPGFGAGHNIVLRQPARLGSWHLILNPDVELAPDALLEALAFMRAQPECVLLSPSTDDADGKRQYLCKRYPSVFDLALRGFAPRWLKDLFHQRLARYEMQDQAPVGGTVLWDPPIVSGCWMLIRSDCLRQLGGFDEGFFLYFEDFDLSLRAAEHGRLAALASVRIVHHGGDAARKGWRHILMFARSGLRFFTKHGWRLC